MATNIAGSKKILAVLSLIALSAAGLGAAPMDEASWQTSGPSAALIHQAALSFHTPGFLHFWNSQPSIDDLYLRADKEFHAGHYWEVRRIYFKIVDLEPTEINGLDGLAFSLAMMKHSDIDAAIGKDLVVTFQKSDFEDLGGIKDKALLAIATDAAMDGFAKGRAVFAWAEPKNSDNPEFFSEYGIHLAMEQGHLLIVDKLTGGLELTREGFEKFEQSADLLRRRQDPGSKALLSRLLLERANLHMTLVRQNRDPSNAAADKTAAIKDYREILTLPDIAPDVSVTILGQTPPIAAAPIMAHSKARAQKHLQELGL